MNTLFENVYDVLFAPRAALKRIAAKPPITQAALVFLLSVLIPVIPMYFTMGANTHFAAGFFIIIQLSVSFLMWFMGAAVWGLMAEFLGGTGRSSSLFAALGFAHIPRIFLVPGIMVVSIMPPAVKQILEVILFVGVLIWSLILDITAIRESYTLSGAKSSLVLLMPMLLMLLIMTIAAIAAGTMLMHLPFSVENALE
jgi:hypothetical protein